MSSNPSRCHIVIMTNDVSGLQPVVSRLLPDYDIYQSTEEESEWPLIDEARPDLILYNLEPGAASFRRFEALIDRLRSHEMDTMVVLLSRDPRKATAVRAMEVGAYDFFAHPIDPDVLHTFLERAVEKQRVERENRILREQVQRKESLGNLIGSSDAMRPVFDLIRRVAAKNTTVCIRGESGTGKELVAHAIHDLSDRRPRPFISVNCAALPETLMEAELFGYEKGAFTGATETKEGRIELAHRGTLFLDEIGTLTPALQSKLLRVLEDRSVIHLGGKRSISVDFRLLTATNEDLEEAVEQKRFREDLYFRIHVVPVLLPPLRERDADIPLLVDHFVRVYCAANHASPKAVSEEAMQTLQNYRWPGNVRELENAVQRIVLMTDGDEIELRDLPRDIVHAASRDGRGRLRLPSSGFDLEAEVESYEKKWVETALAQASGVKIQAARLLGVNKDRMKYLCRKHQL
ncbi:MAG TPA: sigma-54 dependent transcriptional regulator [Candidatus Acidoferrales bacterium]|nr:sigma-54 dependent transcriptional regulator [Candidatus Acidoferrales bacterium]